MFLSPGVVRSAIGPTRSLNLLSFLGSFCQNAWCQITAPIEGVKLDLPHVVHSTPLAFAPCGILISFTCGDIVSGPRRRKGMPTPLSIGRLQDALDVLFEQQPVRDELRGSAFHRCDAIAGVRITLSKRQARVAGLLTLVLRLREREHRAGVVTQLAFAEAGLAQVPAG